MVRKGNWFSSVKKALSPDSNEKKDQEPITVPAVQTVARVEGAKIARFAGKPKDEVAAIKIQTAFRRCLARRALQALRGLARLKSLMEGAIVKRQAASTLRSMQTLARVQSQIHSRRIRMLEENQALQRQILQKHAKELDSMRIGEEWDDSLQSKEQIEAKLLSKYEAAMRRERALAYSFTRQQNGKTTCRSINPMFMDSTNPSWGWSWLERWTAAQTWEARNLIDKDLNDRSSVRSSIRSITGVEISKSFARFQLNSEKHSPTASQNPVSPNFQSHPTPSKPPSPSVAMKLKKASPKGSLVMDDDSKSMVSVQFRRHTIASSSVRDDESLASSPSVPSYMVPTQSVKAKSRTQSPLATANCQAEKGSFRTAKKRLSYPASPARPRRHSGPAKVERSLNEEFTVAK
ncbi:putative IQ motif, EF-hand binding protein [Lupinus albus]|uniref:Putative IQ motif, EF-hand binding protein n=1 Tax=Lupinus albus TaxID=3870 RepID=A0A6A4NDD3_LUPAL|nr:putative IQ motif, EF-hand binding protein [Lupinus albus]